MATQREYWDWALEWRGIERENACEKCGGAGSRAYGSTATWMGGIGGQAITNGVCYNCWGSGDKTRPGVNLRKFIRATGNTHSVQP